MYNLNHPIAIRKNKTVYYDDGKTIKLFIEGCSASDILNEALNQSRVVEGTDLHVPKLIEVTKINNRWAIVYEYAEGRTLESIIDEHPELQDDYLRKFVEIQLTILSKKVPLLNRIKDKFKRKLTSFTDIDENTRFELLQRLEGMKNHDKLCHGDLSPANIIVNENGDYIILDWAHATQGNASADAARTFLLFSMHKGSEIAEKYLDIFCEMSTIEKSNVQRWIPIVAATQMTKGIKEEQEFLSKWIDIVDYE